MKQTRSFLKTSRTHRRSKETCLCFKVGQTKRIALKALFSPSTDWRLPSCQRKSVRATNPCSRRVCINTKSVSEISWCSKQYWAEPTPWTCSWTTSRTSTYCSRSCHHPCKHGSRNVFTWQTFVPKLSMSIGTRPISSKSFVRSALWSLRTRWIKPSKILLLFWAMNWTLRRRRSYWRC